MVKESGSSIASGESREQPTGNHGIPQRLRMGGLRSSAVERSRGWRRSRRLAQSVLQKQSLFLPGEGLGPCLQRVQQGLWALTPRTVEGRGMVVKWGIK